jgi:hypothetical protein
MWAGVCQFDNVGDVGWEQVSDARQAYCGELAAFVYQTGYIEARQVMGHVGGLSRGIGESGTTDAAVAAEGAVLGGCAVAGEGEVEGGACFKVLG